MRKKDHPDQVRASCLVATLLSAVFLAYAAPDAAALVEVRQDGFGDATTIAQGLLLAAPGEEVRVTDVGTYLETGLHISGSRRLTSFPVGAEIQGNGVTVTLGAGGESNQIEGFTIVSDTICIVVNADDSSLPRIVNCSIRGVNALVTGVQVFNGVSSTTTPANVELLDVTFNTLGRGLYHTGAGFGDVAAQAACVYLVTALDFSAISGNCLYFDRPASGIFNGALVDGVGSDVIHVTDGSRHSHLEFVEFNAMNFLGSALELRVDQVYMALVQCHFAGGARGVNVPQVAMPSVPGRATIVIHGPGSLVGSMENAIALDNPAIVDLRDMDLGAAGSPQPNGVALYATSDAFEADLSASDCRFLNNGTRAIYAEPSADKNWEFLRCEFSGSPQAEILFDSSFQNGNSLTLDRCLVREDPSRLGGGQASLTADNTNVALLNCVFDLNANGAVAHTGVQPLNIVHSTIAAPSAAAVTGIAVNANGLTLRNSIVDVPSGDVVTGPGAWTEANNCLRGLVPVHLPISPNSIVADPMFTIPSTGSGTGDFTPAPGSPCPGLGDPGVFAGVDFNGVLRPVPIGSNPDAGAYETILLPVELSAFALE
jgi:hypothetical protein